jgi:hypothetical protein
MKAAEAEAEAPGEQPAGAAVLEVAAIPRPAVLLRAAGPRAVAEATRLAVLLPAAAVAAAGPRWLAVQEPLTAAQALEEEEAAAGPQEAEAPEEAWPQPPEAELAAQQPGSRSLTGRKS